MLNSEKVSLAIFAMVCKNLSSVCIRCSSLLLELATFLRLSSASVTVHILRAHLHISIHRALLLGAEKARVVLR